ncbi:MAG: 16S rRNA (guanine(966)-N(2))-methyltransferase RsmD [Hyphomicrobiales bacterium]
MRIVAGKFKGRRLTEPKSNDVRPTSDRARETIFNILQHGCGVSFEGMRAVDLFAGTGALGLEALSRGASFCLFVEQAAESRALIRTNVEALGQTGATKIYRRDATNLGMSSKLGQFDLALLDPPYGKELGEAALSSLHEGGWFADEAICVLEERKGVEVSIPTPFEVLDRRELADTQIIFLQVLKT